MTDTLEATIPQGTTKVSELVVRATEFLDRCHGELLDLDLGHMDELVILLASMRCALSPRDWHAFTHDVVAEHRVRALMHEEPVTRRAFEKPRGYPGDAPLLDLIYGETVCREMTGLGALLHRWAAPQTAFCSVRERREILAAYLDAAAHARTKPRILALACGHLREARRSDAVRRGEIGEIVALDQDALSLDLVVREAGDCVISPVHASIRKFLVDPKIYGEFDFVYAAGLYDYLEAPIARRLTSSMFSSLRPRGRLLVANFAPNMREIGYMEAIMDWSLIYRDEDDVAAFAADIAANEVRAQDIARDSQGNIVYLTVEKC